MRYKQFGKTGMQVSEMALGTWGIGGVGWDTHSEESRLDAIRAAVEAGVTFFDTAPAYNAGVAEQVLGKALADLDDLAVADEDVGGFVQTDLRVDHVRVLKQ